VKVLVEINSSRLQTRALFTGSCRFGHVMRLDETWQGMFAAKKMVTLPKRMASMDPFTDDRTGWL